MMKEIWNSMLDADMNVRYFSYLIRKNYRNDKYAKIFLAITASGTVASWGFWIDYEIVWQILSGASAVIAIIIPIVNWPKSIEKLSELKKKWWEILYDYEELWVKRSSLSSSELSKKFSEVRKRELRVSELESEVPNKRELLKKCQREVILSRGLLNQYGD